MNQNKHKLQCICGATIFNVFKKTDCSTCQHNGAWEETTNSYIHGLNTHGLTREEDYREGICEIGKAYGHGCHKYSCAVCGEIKGNVPMMKEF